MNCMLQFDDYIVGSWTDASGFWQQVDHEVKQQLARAKNVALSVGGALFVASALFAAPTVAFATTWTSHLNPNEFGENTSAQTEHVWSHASQASAKTEISRIHAAIEKLRANIRNGDVLSLDPELLPLAREAHEASVARNVSLPIDWANQLVNSQFT